ncbi:MAG: efflux RND transporter periplasmic adaptor subunit [Bacteroidota bacterium]
MKRRIVISIAAVAVVLALGLLILRNKPRTAVAEAAYIPVRVTRGRLTVEVDTSGKVAASHEVDLFPAQGGKIIAVYVEPGDSVKAGQILVRLDPSDVETRLRQAEDAWSVARAKLRSVKETAALSPAQARAQVDRAKAALASARSKLDQLRAGPSAEEIAQARSAANQAKLTLDAARIDFERMQRLYAENAVTKQQLDAAENKYLAAKESLDSAEARLAQLLAPPKTEDLAAAEANLAQAQADLEIAEENARHAGQDDQVAAAEADERRAYDAYLAAKKDAAGMVLAAPFDGLVTQVTAKAGTYAPAQTALVSLADPRVLVVEAEVDEHDIAQVAPDQPAVISLDALPGEEFAGKVLSVGGLGREQSGVVTFTVKVMIVGADRRIKPGMNADAAIIVVDRPGVLSVPNTALETRMGRTVVRLYTGGKVQYRRVETGMRTETATEIIAGLRAGDTVAVPAPKTMQQSETSRGRGGFFRMPMGRPRR